MSNWNQTRFKVHCRFHDELKQLVENRVDEISKQLGKTGWLKSFDEYTVEVEYRDSCHCHPEYKTWTFPATWLFAPDRAALIMQYIEEQRKKQAETLEKNRALRRQQDQKEFERLRERLNNGDTAG